MLITAQMEEQIWEILDGVANNATIEAHEKLIETNDVYKNTFMQCEHLHRQLHALELDAPSMRFTENILERLEPQRKIAPVSYALPIGFLSVMSVLMAVFAVFMLKTPVNNDSSAPFSKIGLSTEGVVSTLSNPIFFNGFILLNIILIFIVFDKKIMRSYFEKNHH